MNSLSFAKKRELYEQGLQFNTNGYMVSPDLKTVYLGIPKNASSFVSQLLQENGWLIIINGDAFINRATNIPGFVHGEVEECIVVLRDPVDRWVSGITQFTASTAKDMRSVDVTDMELFSTMFDVIDVDDHTLPQHYFLDELYPGVTKTYFNVEPMLGEKLSAHLNLHHSIDYANHNVASEVFRDKLKEELYKVLMYEGYSNKIKQYYNRDYDLINSVDYTP